MALLLIAITLHQHPWYADLLHLGLTLLLLILLERDLKRVQTLCWHSWKLLRWILLPTLLLHTLFTPGALLFVGFPVPMSQEGLQLGAQLGLHLATIFMLAMLLARLFPISFWLQWITRYPTWQSYLYPYLILFPIMNRYVRALLRRHYRQWRRSSSKFQQLPRSFLQLIIEMKKYAHIAARRTWQTWGTAHVQPHAFTAKPIPQQHLITATLLTLMSISIEAGVLFW